MRPPPTDRMAWISYRPGRRGAPGISGWEELGLGRPPDQRPLYVGKSESSLAGRDVGTHFGYADAARSTSLTGGSTVRRSLAALLHDARGFRGVPRNPDKPGHFSNYGLTPAHDGELCEWMREHLLLAGWPKPDACTDELEPIEQGVFRRLLPPLNLTGVVTPWKRRVDVTRLVTTEAAVVRVHQSTSSAWGTPPECS